MSNEEKSEVKNSIRKEFLWPGLGVLAILAGFYYNTNSSIAEHDKRFAEHKEELSSIKVEIKGKASTEDMKDLKQDMRDLQASNQKILEILLDNQK